MPMTICIIAGLFLVQNGFCLTVIHPSPYRYPLKSPPVGVRAVGGGLETKLCSVLCKDIYIQDICMSLLFNIVRPFLFRSP